MTFINPDDVRKRKINATWKSDEERDGKINANHFGFAKRKVYREKSCVFFRRVREVGIKGIRIITRPTPDNARSAVILSWRVSLFFLSPPFPHLSPHPRNEFENRVSKGGRMRHLYPAE